MISESKDLKLWHSIFRSCSFIYRIAENFGGKKLCGKFGDLLRQLLVISEKAIEAGLKSVKVFFAKCNLACNSPKFLISVDPLFMPL